MFKELEESFQKINDALAKVRKELAFKPLINEFVKVEVFFNNLDTTISDIVERLKPFMDLKKEHQFLSKLYDELTKRMNKLENRCI